MTEIRVLDCLGSVDASQWNACFPGELEGYAYLRAVEESGMADFHWRYLTAWENKRLIAAMPAFLTAYKLDTTLEGVGKQIINRLRRYFPNLLTLKLACLGSPVTEFGLVGFHPSIPDADKSPLLHNMIKAFESYAVQAGYSLFGLKDIPVRDDMLWKDLLLSLGYCSVPGQPVAGIAINFSSSDDYFAKLSYATRKDMRRKLRMQKNIRTEYRDNIDDALKEVMSLYQQTRDRAEMTFEELTPAFFQNILRDTNSRALCTLYYAGEELLAANLLLADNEKLLDKYFCMDSIKGRAYNLYFLSWFTNIHYCLDHGLKHYQSGQAAYENKLRLGCSLERTTLYFRHRNRLIQRALRLVAPLLGADDTLDTLQQETA